VVFRVVSYPHVFGHMHATCPAPIILPDLISLITFREVYKLRSSSLCSLLQPPTNSPLLGPNILLSTLFSDAFNVRLTVSVTDQVSHPYKTVKIIIWPRRTTVNNLSKKSPVTTELHIGSSHLPIIVRCMNNCVFNARLCISHMRS
jgi:hypothetical protein